ncbi:mediator complex subunit MED14-domain-containing protein [Coprinopsis sp. MPI-PUGE-AT-0042]|nr:mediator complex subunit MED14-domain-containing protein [Coprinopsis sp. MPI-PUGE-AT-0042]
MEEPTAMAVDAVGNGSAVPEIPRPWTPVEELERELPEVYDGQIALGDLLSRVVQAIYAELTEMAETLPSMSDAVRKRTIADWVVKIKKQVVKLYAVAKWSRDAETVQKCMNITAFLLTQNHQFDEVVRALTASKDNLDPARLRNHDLLTSLDVLTTGSYLRLPTCIKKRVVPSTPLTDEEVAKTLRDMESAILYRLRMSELIPVEMLQYTIADGRVHFTVPKLFELSLCLLGPSPDSGWFFAHVEFLFTVKGDVSEFQDFPRKPTGVSKAVITQEADYRLSYYLYPDADPTRPKLPSGVVDTPLVRIYNFLQLTSLSYQLEILWFQARRMLYLGWVEYLTVDMSADRKTMKTSYWVRSDVQPTGIMGRPKQPPYGGTLTISIENIDAHSSRTPKGHTLARLQQQVKLGSRKPSDDVEKLKLQVTWEPCQGVLGVEIPPSAVDIPPSELEIDADNVDFESLLLRVIQKHVAAVLRALTQKLQLDPSGEFSTPGLVTAEEGALHVQLCADEVVTINIDQRTGRLNMRDINGLLVAGRSTKFNIHSVYINKEPEHLVARMSNLRLATIIKLLDQKARYLGLEYYMQRNIHKDDEYKFAVSRARMFIRLKKYPTHYLVLAIQMTGISFMLIKTASDPNDSFAPMAILEVAHLDVARIQRERLAAVDTGRQGILHGLVGNELPQPFGFDLTTDLLQEIYSYSCARVAYSNVESQFKSRGIMVTEVSTTLNGSITPEMARTQSSLSRSVPALCVAARSILSGKPAGEAAMPNIRVIPLNWWSDEKAQVVTCVKLKYVQQPLGKRAGSSSVIRPSKRIIYDTKEAVVSFLSEDVEHCVDEFLEEWARVSKMVVIAREIARMSKENGRKEVLLLSFDLQTVEFAYAPGYSVSITCENQLSTGGGNFDLRFSRFGVENPDDLFNPHDDAEPYLSNILRQGHGKLALALERLVVVLQDTLPIAVELEAIRKDYTSKGCIVDTFAKGSGWYRILYPDFRHAIDFRLMAEHRVSIQDASHSLFKPARVDPSSDGDAKMGEGKDTAPTEPSGSTPIALSASTSNSSTASQPTDKSLPGSLLPITGFAGITKEVVTAVVAERKGIKYLADLGVGVVCETSAVGLVARKIHEKVVEKLNLLP